MSEAMARALGAGSPMNVVIGGKECFVRPLSIQELTEVERDCLQRWRRNYVETWAAMADLMPAGTAQSILERKIEEAARWDIDDLPAKAAYDASRVKVTEELKSWLTETLGLDREEKRDDPGWQRLASASLDKEMLGEDLYQSLTGQKAPRLMVPYVNWWITGSYEGMITFVWICFRHNNVTRDQVITALRENVSLLMDLSREIERLSSPAVGNG